MQRYFSDKKIDNYYLLNQDDEYHIIHVMRMKLKDKIEIVDKKKTYLCEIISLNPVKAMIIETILENHENEKPIIIVQSLVNEQKMDFILQKGTELGADAFYPYQAVNSVVKENQKSAKKIIRWQKIVKEAAEQSKRNIIPLVHNIIDLKELCQIDASLKIFLSVNEMTKNVKNILQSNIKCDTIIIVVGPEGGFTKLEEETLEKNGFVRASLGRRVLRTETASLAFLAMANYEWMV